MKETIMDKRYLLLMIFIVIITGTSALKVESPKDPPATITAIASDFDWLWIAKSDGEIYHVYGGPLDGRPYESKFVAYPNNLDYTSVTQLDMAGDCLVALHTNQKIYRICRREESSGWDTIWKEMPRV